MYPLSATFTLYRTIFFPFLIAFTSLHSSFSGRSVLVKSVRQSCGLIKSAAHHFTLPRPIPARNLGSHVSPEHTFGGSGGIRIYSLFPRYAAFTCYRAYFYIISITYTSLHCPFALIVCQVLRQVGL